MNKIINHIRLVWKSFGAYAAFIDFFYVVFERLIDSKVFVAVLLEPTAISASALTDRYGYTSRFMRPEELRNIAQANPDIFPLTFVNDALAKGDRCFGILDGERLISAGWYSTQTTAMNEFFEIGFSPEYVYMYRGFTDPEYRGKNLHGFGMASAVMAYQKEGSRGLVSYVAANNFASLRSCYRLGYKKIGNIVTARVAGKYRSVLTKGCKKYDLSVTPTNHEGELALNG